MTIGEYLPMLYPYLPQGRFYGFPIHFTEDAQIYGTDPAESPFEPQTAIKPMEGVFATKDIKLQFDLKKRNIIVAPDKKSAWLLSKAFILCLGKICKRAWSINLPRGWFVAL